MPPRRYRPGLRWNDVRVAAHNRTVPADVADTRTAYDDFADSYAEFARDHLATEPFDRAMLGAVAELVRANGSGRVADLGCGAGRMTAHLSECHAGMPDLSAAGQGSLIRRTRVRAVP